MSALLTFSLGPVQPFIAQARKTRDLWIGSYLLSTLMREALRDFPGELLFPVLSPATASSIHRANAIADLPNKFVARHRTVAEAIDAATKSGARIEKTWRLLTNQVWEHVFGQEQDATLTEIWQRQTNPTTLFEVYWAVVPYDDGSSASSYGVVYQHAQALLDARKRLRTFACSDEPGEKSTISGEREALHHGRAGPPPVSVAAASEQATTPTRQSNHRRFGFFGRQRDQAARPPVPAESLLPPQGPPAAPHIVTPAEMREFWQRLGQRFPDSQLGRSGRERLDAVDVIKRFATDVPLIGRVASFPSTDTLAAMPFFCEVIQQLQQPSVPVSLCDAAKAWALCAERAYRAAPEALPALDRLAASSVARNLLRCDGEALHAGSFSPRALQDTALDQATIADLAERGPKVLSAFRGQARELGIAPPSSYYAVLLLDGDRVGQLLSSITSPEDHGKFSEALSRFAHTHPRDIIEDRFYGRVVYAGGDDVLAFLPALHVLRAAQDLRAAYGQALAAFGRNQQGVAASAGIAIAHRRMPLRMVLATARDAEHAAKERYGRDALSVSLLRRSGAVTVVGAHWSYSPASPTPSDAASGPIQPVLAVSERLRTGDLSPRFVYTVMEEAPILAALDGAARHAELSRLLRRQRQPDRVEHFPDDALDALAKQLVILAGAFDERLPNGLPAEAGYDLAAEGPRRGMVELSGWLLIAAFLARGEDED